MAHTKGAPWNLTTAPPTKDRGERIRKGGSVRDTYNALHLAWRAGLVDSFYYGQRSPQDPTIVWELDANEMPGNETAHVAKLVADRLRNNGVASIVWGDQWCGYRAVTITYTDGREVTETYNGREVVLVGAALELAS